MTQYDVLRVLETTLTDVEKKGCRLQDVRYMDMYRDYLRLCAEGHKKMYINTFLSEEYGIHPATVYEVAARMTKEID